MLSVLPTAALGSSGLACYFFKCEWTIAIMLRRSALTLAILAIGGQSHAEGIEFKFSGFGTLGLTHSSERGADYAGTPFQPNGAGATRNPDFGPESRLGGQMNVRFGNNLSGVIQLISQKGTDNSYTPQVEWLNLKYQISESLSVRAGRIAVPPFLLSETRHVGYASPWAHTPNEVYFVVPITNNDGVDIAWRQRFGQFNNSFQAYYGVNDAKRVGGARIKASPSWGFANSTEIGALTLRASYTDVKARIGIPALTNLMGGFAQLANSAAAIPSPTFQAAAGQARALADEYHLNDVALKIGVIGANYDPGDWFVMAEATKYKGQSFFKDKTAWYLSGGYRLGKWTPYATVAAFKTNQVQEAGITAAAGTPLAAGAAGLVGGLNAVLRSLSPSQDSVSAGVRWDVMHNVALKAQYDHVSLKDHSAGRFINVRPGFALGGKVNLFTLTADFVF